MKTPREFAEDIGFVLFGDNMNEDDLVHIEAQIDAVQRDAIEAAAKVARSYACSRQHKNECGALACCVAIDIADDVSALVPNAGGEQGG